MDKFQIINRILNKKKGNLINALAKAKETRDNAPGAMESHHDTTRNQSEKIVGVLEEQLEGLEEDMKKVNSTNRPFPFMEINFNGEDIKFILVPEGLGGEKIDGVRLLSEASPLGILLSGKHIGDKFEFNDQKIEILRIE